MVEKEKCTDLCPLQCPAVRQPENRHCCGLLNQQPFIPTNTAAVHLQE